MSIPNYYKRFEEIVSSNDEDLLCVLPSGLCRIRFVGTGTLKTRRVEFLHHDKIWDTYSFKTLDEHLPPKFKVYEGTIESLGFRRVPKTDGEVYTFGINNVDFENHPGIREIDAQERFMVSVEKDESETFTRSDADEVKEINKANDEWPRICPQDASLGGQTYYKMVEKLENQYRKDHPDFDLDFIN